MLARRHLIAAAGRLNQQARCGAHVRARRAFVGELIASPTIPG
jgi:hypothetical protein